MLAGGLLFGGVFFGLHPMITLSGTHGRRLARPRAHPALLPLRARGDVLHRLAGAAVQRAHRLEPHGADRHHRHLHRRSPVLIAFSYFDWLRPWVFPQLPPRVHQLLPRPDLLAADPQGAGVVRASGAAGSRSPPTCSSGARTCCRRVEHGYAGARESQRGALPGGGGPRHRRHRLGRALRRRGMGRSSPAATAAVGLLGARRRRPRRSGGAARGRRASCSPWSSACSSCRPPRRSWPPPCRTSSGTASHHRSFHGGS